MKWPTREGERWQKNWTILEGYTDFEAHNQEGANIDFNNRAING